MRWFAWCLMLSAAAFLGCAEPANETTPTVTPVTEGGDHDHAEGHDHDHEGHDHEGHAEGEAHQDDGTHAGEEDSAATEPAEQIRFVADKSIQVPGMMCPFSCWPKVQETLAAQPGVEGVQLAEQPAGTPEGTIEKRVVELKLKGDFDSEAALAALSKISFEGEVLN